MEWKEFTKKSAENRKDDDAGVSISTALAMEWKVFSILTE